MEIKEIRRKLKGETDRKPVVISRGDSMIVTKGVLNKAHVEVFSIGESKISMSFSGDTELSFRVNKKQEKKLNNFLQKTMKEMTRIIIKIEEEKNAFKS